MIPLQLNELLDRTGLDVLDHLEREVTVPVLDGLQAQGDLIVIPADLLPTVRVWSRWAEDLPPEGVELVRGQAGRNPHTLVADRWACMWTSRLDDSLGLTIAWFANNCVSFRG